jgi:hypothetical protein
MKNFDGKNQEKRLLTDTAEKRDPGSHLRHGLLMANVGLLLIIFSECEVLREGWHALLYIGGATLCVAGIILVDRRAKSRSSRRMPAQGSGNPPPEEAGANQFG